MVEINLRFSATAVTTKTTKDPFFYPEKKKIIAPLSLNLKDSFTPSLQII